MNSLFANSYNAFPFGMSLGLLTVGAILFFILMVVVLALKGYALWYAAKRDETAWFVALLVLNTMGILELVYLYFIVKKWRANGENPETPSQSTATSSSATPPTPPPASTPSAQ